MRIQILILGFKGVMKTLFSIVVTTKTVDSLERETLHYAHNKRHLWFFFKMADRYRNCQLQYWTFCGHVWRKTNYNFILPSCLPSALQMVCDFNIWVRQVSPNYKVTSDTPFIFKLVCTYMYEVAGRVIHLDH